MEKKIILACKIIVSWIKAGFEEFLGCSKLGSFTVPIENISILIPSRISDWRSFQACQRIRPSPVNWIVNRGGVWAGPSPERGATGVCITPCRGKVGVDSSTRMVMVVGCAPSPGRDGVWVGPIPKCGIWSSCSGQIGAGRLSFLLPLWCWPRVERSII